MHKPLNTCLAISLSAFAIEIALTFYAYFHLPQTIPIHFNGNDIPNGYGDKSYIFLFLSINMFLFVMLSGLILLFRKHSDRRLVNFLQLIRVIIPLFGIGDIIQTLALVNGHIALKYISDMPTVIIVAYVMWHRKTLFKQR